MTRVLVIAALVLAGAPDGLLAQSAVALHIKVSIVDADGRTVPVARHALLVSDNPATAAPKRIVTSTDGTADIRLRPGSYTIESDRPFVLQGHSYEWTESVDIAAGKDAALELTAKNAAVGLATAEMAAAAKDRGPGAAVSGVSASGLLAEWQDSVVSIWTPHMHASGFLAAANGLVATSKHALGDETAIEVQVSASVKVTARVVTDDPARDVAVLWIDPAAVRAVRPVPLACGPGSSSEIQNAQELFAITAPPRGPRDIQPGMPSDFVLPLGTAGGPVFATAGPAIGLTSPASTADERVREDVRVVGAGAVCEAVAAAGAKIAALSAPDATHLPVESDRPVSLADAKTAAGRRGLSLSAYSVTSSDFDIVFITPVLLAGVEDQQGRTGGRNDADTMRALTEFGNWSGYVADAPPVVLVRVTPRLVEGFWMKFARGAASTQGASIPPIKRLRPGFSRMRVLCGGREVTPIHPFKIRQRVSETEGIDEGLYVFDPAAIGPHCGTVSLVLSSVKEPDKTETKTVDPAVIQQVWQDFLALGLVK